LAFVITQGLVRRAVRRGSPVAARRLVPRIEVRGEPHLAAALARGRGTVARAAARPRARKGDPRPLLSQAAAHRRRGLSPGGCRRRPSPRVLRRLITRPPRFRLEFSSLASGAEQSRDIIAEFTGLYADYVRRYPSHLPYEPSAGLFVERGENPDAES
jgi:hypothetical protein